MKNTTTSFKKPFFKGVFLLLTLLLILQSQSIGSSVVDEERPARRPFSGGL